MKGRGVGAGGRGHPRSEEGRDRVAQEALNTVVSHAEAGRVEVGIETTPEQIVLTIEDDGRGFNIEDVTDAGYGLVGLNERARLLGGELTLER